MATPTLADLPTPALVIDLAVAGRNIERLAAYAKAHGLGVRPHTKTHKSLLMARAQLRAGAAGLTVAKVGEAEVMADAGDDILVAYPAVDPPRTRRLAALARRRTVRVAVDSAYAIEALAEAARQAGSTIGLLVDLDVGMHRTGVQTPQESLALAQQVARSRGMRLDGLFTYPGHASGPTEQRRQTMQAVAALLAETLELWRRHGLEAGIVSGGSTPTAFDSHLIPGVTEIRPGTYIFYDRNCLVAGWCEPQDVAATVLCTVVSTAVPGKAVLDAGSKTLTSDRCVRDAEMAGYGCVVELPGARIVRLTEEHGEVELSPDNGRPEIGQRVRVIPNHICPCVNLHDAAWLKHEDGSLEKLPIEARGRLS